MLTRRAMKRNPWGVERWDSTHECWQSGMECWGNSKGVWGILILVTEQVEAWVRVLNLLAVVEEIIALCWVTQIQDAVINSMDWGARQTWVHILVPLPAPWPWVVEFGSTSLYWGPVLCQPLFLVLDTHLWTTEAKAPVLLEVMVWCW